MVCSAGNQQMFGQVVLVQMVVPWLFSFGSKYGTDDE
jgi:hypothetical protein